MNNCVRSLLLSAFTSIFYPCVIVAQVDPGSAEVGTLHVSVLYATNNDPSQAGKALKQLPESSVAILKNIQHFNYQHFRALGSDIKPVFKSYENWAEPLKPSDEILLRFESSSALSARAMTLDLELWLSRKKALKTNIRVEHGKPFYIKGPSWRGGTLIITLELSDKTAEKVSTQ